MVEMDVLNLLKVFEQLNDKTLNELFLIQVLDKLYRLIDVEKTNLISTNQIMEFITYLTDQR